MKKYRFLLFVSIHFLAVSFDLTAQESELDKISNEIAKEFLSFDFEGKRVDSLLIKISAGGLFKFDTLVQSSNNNLLYTRAFSNSFNPFYTKGTCELQIREAKILGGGINETGLVFQISLLPQPLDSTGTTVQKEFKDVRKRFNNFFRESGFNKSSKNKLFKYASCNFVVNQKQTITLGWGKHYKYQNQYCLYISFFTKQEHKNTAVK